MYEIKWGNGPGVAHLCRQTIAAVPQTTFNINHRLFSFFLTFFFFKKKKKLFDSSFSGEKAATLPPTPSSGGNAQLVKENTVLLTLLMAIWRWKCWHFFWDRNFNISVDPFPTERGDGGGCQWNSGGRLHESWTCMDKIKDDGASETDARNRPPDVHEKKKKKRQGRWRSSSRLLERVPPSRHFNSSAHRSTTRHLVSIETHTIDGNRIIF